MYKKDFPDHHDAELVLKLYELRREDVMRASRAALSADFWPKSWDDVQAVTRLDHPLNPAWRQCATYWEMVYGMAKHGVVHPDFMMESCGEGIFLYARIEPYLPQLREVNPFAFRNAEWVVTNSDRGKALLELFRARVKTLLAARA